MESVFFFLCQLIDPECRIAGKNTRLPAFEMAAGDLSTSTHNDARAHNESNNIKGVNKARGGKSRNNKCFKGRGASKETEPGLFETRRQRFYVNLDIFFLIKDYVNQTCFFVSRNCCQCCI